MSKPFLTRLAGLIQGMKPSSGEPLPSYAAVTATSTGRCCEAARATQATPILLSTQPELPLPNCSMPDACVCRFRHWPDRRIGERRLPDDLNATVIQPGLAKERSRGDRRRPK